VWGTSLRWALPAPSRQPPDCENGAPRGRRSQSLRLIPSIAASDPLGVEIAWKPARLPKREPLQGSHVLVRPLDAAADAESLFSASHPPEGDTAIWTYLPYGPYDSVAELRQRLEWAESSEDPLFFSVVRPSDDRPLGVGAYMEITPEFGVIEVGHIWFGVPLQRTTAATESIYLLARHAFDELGYRRLEWRCNALNSRSRSAAERFGFTFEGIFRNHMVVKGRNRDTAWYAITDDEWHVIRGAFEAWLAPENFAQGGIQRRSLGQMISDARTLGSHTS
jgi:RimJ/RimL family protein N-acetyltransferase